MEASVAGPTASGGGKWAMWESTLRAPSAGGAPVLHADAAPVATADLTFACPLAAALVVFLVLAVLQPPFVMASAASEYDAPSLQWNRVLLWTLATLCAAHVLPLLAKPAAA